MRRRHEVQKYPIRRGSGRAHRIQVILVADERATSHGLHARLARMVRRTMSGDMALDGVEAPSGLSVVSPPNPLSTREREVLAMLARGLRNKEIADRLFITNRTVTWHTQSIYRKLDVANRTEAVTVALRRGIVALDLPIPPASDAA